VFQESVSDTLGLDDADEMAGSSDEFEHNENNSEIK
jgi:hypothetical protein